MKLRNLLLAATVLGLPVVARAQPVSGLYVGAGAGWNYLQTDKFKNVTSGGVATVGSGQKLYDGGGPVVVGSVGYGLGNGLRLELEGNYRQEHFRIKNTGVAGGGNVLDYGPMFNVLYDVDVGAPVVPYLGAGVGYGFTQLQGASAYSTTGTGSTLSLSNRTTGGVSAQGILGLAYSFPEAPGLAVTGEYRFFSDPQSEKFKGTSTVGGVSAGASAKLGSQYNHALLVGLRYAFNAAPPPPPPAPAVTAPPAAAVTRTYLVFFDWDKADLNARARAIIAEAAQNSTRVQYTRIDVSGYTDTSGTATYNQGLSIRRAQSVQAELVKDGVPAANIDIHGYGETHPLVPTGPGIREPQNRRVEIVFK